MIGWMSTQQTPGGEDEMRTIVRRRTPSIPTAKAEDTTTVILQIGDSLVRLTAHQARRLASVLVVQADIVTMSRAEPVDSFLVDGWIYKPSNLRECTHRKLLIACRASNVIVREANPV